MFSTIIRTAADQQGQRATPASSFSTARDNSSFPMMLAEGSSNPLVAAFSLDSHSRGDYHREEEQSSLTAEPKKVLRPEARGKLDVSASEKKQLSTK
ncbi:unnamed protein product [Amoebophrya sp. A25]|nr:unnamed protein product [Amoebophrya sp. A25]|eukprot:GSA25T00005632001.1